MKKGKGDPFGKENSTDAGWDVAKGVADAADNNVLEDGCFLGKRRSAFKLDEIAFVYELEWKFYYCREISHRHTLRWMPLTQEWENSNDCEKSEPNTSLIK